MVKPIMRDLFFCARGQKKQRKETGRLRQIYWIPKAHEDGCVGMAANMSGVNKAIIAVNMGFMNVAMFNPKIVRETEV